jgi:hypothetical protein
MGDVLQTIGIILTYSIVLGAIPVFLLHVVRSLADQRTRLKELQARVDLLEARAGQYERVT